MAQFTYRALAADGHMSEGRLEASGRQEALRQLDGLGLRPIRVDEQGGTPSKDTAAGGRSETDPSAQAQRRVSSRELENFMRQLSSLLTAGVPLSRALQLLSRESDSRAGAAHWRTIHDLVIDGMPLADAMQRLPGTFPRVYVAMVRAGETGGFLDLVLGQIAEFQARDKELRGKVTSALVYPAVLLVLAIGVLIFLLTFFIPRFQGIFEGFGAALPLITRLIIGASHVVTQYGLFVAVGLGLAVYGIRQWLRTEQGRRAWDAGLLRAAVVGPLAARFAMTRFCRMLGTLTHSGVPLLTGLRVARESIGNQTLVDAVGGSIERVQKGDSLAASLGDCPQLFPLSVIEMIAVAEESGRLDEELMRLANVTEQELDGRLRMAVALAEPLMLFLMAGFIGTIFIGMVIPIFTIQDYIK